MSTAYFLGEKIPDVENNITITILIYLMIIM